MLKHIDHSALANEARPTSARTTKLPHMHWNGQSAPVHVLDFLLTRPHAPIIARVAGAGNPLAVPIAVVMGVPLYANIAGVLPITEALVSKGMALGTVLSFTMAVTALSLPEIVILRKVLRPQLLGVFIGLMTMGIVSVGYLFNTVL